MFNTGLPQKFDITEISSKPILTYRDLTIHSLVEITLLTDYNVHFCDILYYVLRHSCQNVWELTLVVWCV